MKTNSVSYTITKEEEDFAYSRIGMALISAQRVEYITGQLIEVLQDLKVENTKSLQQNSLIKRQSPKRLSKLWEPSLDY